MAQTIKLVYIMIIFFSIFLVSMNADGNTFFTHFKFGSILYKYYVISF